MLPTPRLHRLRREDEEEPVDALIVVLYGEGEQAGLEQLARQWAPAVPRAAFAGLQLDLDPLRLDLPRLRALIREAADEHDLHGRQIVLAGAGRAGRLAIDLSMLGVAPGAAVMALDLPLEAVPTSLAPLAGANTVLLISVMAGGSFGQSRDGQRGAQWDRSRAVRGSAERAFEFSI